MEILKQTIAILFLVLGALFVPTVFAFEPQTKEIKSQNLNLPSIPAEGEIVLVIDGKVIKAEADQREVLLTNFLKAKNSPLTPYAADFIRIADKYDLDYRFLPAIAGLESAWGKALRPGTHNPFGWGPHIAFKSYPDAFEAVASGIRSRYVKTGKVTPQAVGPKYAASKTWSTRVSGFMLQIENLPL